MQAVEFSIPQEMLQQLEMFRTFAAQGQDAMSLIQELFRRTDVLGQAVMQVGGLGQTVHDSMASREEDIKARLGLLELETSRLRVDVDACQNACFHLRGLVADVQTLRAQLDATNALVSALSQSISEMRLPEEEVQARPSLTQRVDDLQDMLNEHAEQLDEMSARFREARHRDAVFETPPASPFRPGTQYYNMSSPEVIAYSPDRPVVQGQGQPPDVFPLLFSTQVQGSASLGVVAAGPLPQGQASSSWPSVRPKHVTEEGGEQLSRLARPPSGPGSDAVPVMAVDQPARQTHEDWKYLRQAPELVVTSERTWERCLALDLWLQQMSICASAVSERMERHWRSVMEQARAMYTRTQSLSVADRVSTMTASNAVSCLPGFEQHENKLLVTLMTVLPAEVKRPLLEARPNSSPSSVELIHQALEWFGPGGREDCTSLLEFVRKPGTNSVSVAECRARLRLWRTARSRLTKLNMSQPPPTEVLTALDEILLPLERRYEALRFALQNARLSPGVRQPTEDGVASYERLAEQELMLLDQDKRVRMSAGVNEISAVQTEQVKKPCHFFNRPGGCNRHPCPFAHLLPGDKRPKAKAKPKAKAEPKGKGKGKGKNPEPKPKAKPKPAAAKAAAEPVVEVLASMVMVSSETEMLMQCLSSAGSGSAPLVLVDSGANQVLRPWTDEVQSNLAGATEISVTLASGEQRQGWKTADGEVVLPRQLCPQVQNKPWILPVSRLVGELGYQVLWKPDAVELVSPEGKKTSCVMKHDLPYIRWKEFLPIRKQLAKSFRSKAALVCAFSENAMGSPDPAVTSEDEVDAENDRDMWVASLCQPAVQGAASVKDIQIRAVEEIAKAYLAECGELTGDALTPFLEPLLMHLPFVMRIVPRMANAGEGGRTNSLVFGLYQHGGFIGVSVATVRMPSVVQLLNTLIKRQLPPDATWTSVYVSKNAHVSPHRDSRNTGVSYLRAFGDFEGGRLWVEDPDGQILVAFKGEKRCGTLYPTKGHWLKVNARCMTHAVEKFVGTWHEGVD